MEYFALGLGLLVAWLMWRYRKSGGNAQSRTYTMAVVGESYANADGTQRQMLIRRHCRPGVALVFQRECKNPHDANAVDVVLEKSGRQIGYLSRDNAAWVAKVMDGGSGFIVSVAGVHGGSGKKRFVGVTINATKI